MVQDDMRRRGYDKEEEYFFRLNQELIEKRRRELDAERAAHRTEEQKNPHWMKCPKCGNDMAEVRLAGILVDECTACQGIFFDHGELETLIASQEPQGFLNSLKRLFGNK